MQRLDTIEDWKTVPARKSLSFDGSVKRQVKLELNAPEGTEFQIIRKEKIDILDEETGEVTDKVEIYKTFLAAVSGRDTVVFSASGAFEIAANKPFAIKSPELQSMEIVKRETDTFAVPVTMPKRNHDQEMAQFKMMQNNNRLLQQMAEDQRKWMEANAKTVDSPKGDSGNAGGTTEPQPNLANEGNSAAEASSGDAAQQGEGNEPQDG